MHITPATLEDARQVAEIHVTTWQSAYQGILPAEYLASLSVGLAPHGLAFLEGSTPDSAEVWALYVAPPSWSSGVGRMLWRRSQARMLEQGFKTVRAWVFTQNARAIKFYRAAGFAPDLSSVKEFELGGKQVQEMRYARVLE
jgi:ribosomal protein S18 acetylase RimI-like enzyme